MLGKATDQAESGDDDLEYCEYSLCPGCGVEQEDQDGFGVLFCNRCLNCKHASVTDDICDFCAFVLGE
jgi:hypothetical protein